MRNFDGTGNFVTGLELKGRREFREEVINHPLTLELGCILKVSNWNAAEVAFEFNAYLGFPYFLKLECVRMAIECKDLSEKILLEMDEEIPF